jgi:stage III sporulation protein AD
MAAFFLRNIKKEYEMPLTLAGCALLLSAALGMAVPIVDYISELSGALPAAGEAFAVMMRALGIAALTRIAAEVCRDMGTPSLASTLEMTAKFEIVLLTLPLISSLLESIRALLSEAGF